VHCKWLQKWKSIKWKIHHDVAPAYAAQLVQQCLAKPSILQVRHPPYLPGMGRNDFFLFPKLKSLERHEI
jgi:hypothetical protein